MNSLYLQPTTEQEIIQICTRFLAVTAAGYDQITVTVIKEIIECAKCGMWIDFRSIVVLVIH